MGRTEEILKPEILTTDTVSPYVWENSQQIWNITEDNIMGLPGECRKWFPSNYIEFSRESWKKDIKWWPILLRHLLLLHILLPLYCHPSCNYNPVCCNWKPFCCNTVCCRCSCVWCNCNPIYCNWNPVCCSCNCNCNPDLYNFNPVFIDHSIAKF